MVDPGLLDMRASNWPWTWCRGSCSSMWVVGYLNIPVSRQFCSVWSREIGVLFLDHGGHILSFVLWSSLLRGELVNLQRVPLEDLASSCHILSLRSRLLMDTRNWSFCMWVYRVCNRVYPVYRSESGECVGELNVLFGDPGV